MPENQAQTDRMRECDCGVKYSLAKRRQEIESMDPRMARGTRSRYCSDNCWQIYTQSQDTLEPAFSEEERESHRMLEVRLAFR